MIYQRYVKSRKTNLIRLFLYSHLEENPTFVLIFNVGNKSETVNLQYFYDIPETLTVEIPSINSEREPG